MTCRNCLTEKKFYKFICRNQGCLPICFDCADEKKTTTYCKTGHIVDETFRSSFVCSILKDVDLQKDWKNRCAEARKYILHSGDTYLLTRDLLLRKELQDLQIVTDINAKKRLEGTVPFTGRSKITYYRNPESTIITKIDLSIRQSSGDDLTKYGKTTFKFCVIAQGDAIISKTLILDDKNVGNESIECCFRNYAMFTQIRVELTAYFETIDEAVEIKVSPEYKVLIDFTSVTIGGNHCSSTRDTNVNFDELFDSNVLFYPTNVMYHRHLMAKFCNDEQKYEKEVQEWIRLG